jgi:hypothetical protein
MVQHTKIYNAKITYKQKQRQKSHDLLNRCTKAFDIIQQTFMIKALKKLGIKEYSSA